MTRKKGSKPEEIGGIVGQVIKKLDTKTHGSKEEIVKAWENAAGADAVRHTKCVAIKKNILTVEIDSSTWLYFLSMKKKSILAAMKKALGEKAIGDIKFRIGEIS
ncbi:MAG: DUF721 domain-containing protein [Candidatus Omnitrophota bacterium]|nr:DUF721 domain-containing protein [Candidatus Omnitrophota bacterium]